MDHTYEILRREKCAHDDGGDWEVRARHEAARIDANMEALLATARAMFAAWAKDGLLDRERAQYEYDPKQRHHVKLPPLKLSEADAVEHQVACIRDVLVDAMSKDAREFVEHVRG